MDLDSLFTGPFTLSKWQAFGRKFRAMRIIAGTGIRVQADGHHGQLVEAIPETETAEKPVPLHLIAKRPAYIPDPGSLASGAKRIFVEWGTLNDQLATNWDGYWDITDTTYFFAKAQLRAIDTLKVTSWEIVTGPSFDSHVTADWSIGAQRPTEAVYLLGSAIFSGGKFQGVTNSGGGSLGLSEHIQSINANASASGAVDFGKQLIFSRLSY